VGFWRNRKRFNVAITRAKALLVVAGHPAVLLEDDSWRELLRWAGAWRLAAGRGWLIAWITVPAKLASVTEHATSLPCPARSALPALPSLPSLPTLPCPLCMSATPHQRHLSCRHCFACGAFRGAGSDTIRQRFRVDAGAAAGALPELPAEQGGHRLEGSRGHMG